MRIFLALLFVLCVGLVQAKAQKFEIIDISQKQIRIFNQSKNLDSLTRCKLLIDSLYTPHKKFMSGYLGSEQSFLELVHETVYPNLDGFNRRNARIDGVKLLEQFTEIKDNMHQQTGRYPEGTWYILFGHGATDLGGLTDGTMLIDLTHGNNRSNDNIKKMFPHEINHQLYAAVKPGEKGTVTSRVISEGFAVYMNGIYWKDKFTEAQNLGYSEEELAICRKSITTIKDIFKEYAQSTDGKTIDSFANRGYRFSAELPPALGYFIGLEIVKTYVSKHGPNSWKNIYELTPKQVYEQSGF